MVSLPNQKFQRGGESRRFCKAKHAGNQSCRWIHFLTNSSVVQRRGHWATNPEMRVRVSPEVPIRFFKAIEAKSWHRIIGLADGIRRHHWPT